MRSVIPVISPALLPCPAHSLASARQARWTRITPISAREEKVLATVSLYEFHRRRWRRPTWRTGPCPKNALWTRRVWEDNDRCNARFAFGTMKLARDNVIDADLSGLTQAERVNYYLNVCAMF